MLRNDQPIQVHNIEVEIRRFSGAKAVRIIDGSNTQINEHTHDWPILSLYVMGDYTKISEMGETRLTSPSAVFHPAGAAHASKMGGRGLEQIDIEFDPAWLPVHGSLQLDKMDLWIGGAVAGAARSLARAWAASSSSQRSLASATGNFLRLAQSTNRLQAPPWLGHVLHRLNSDAAHSTSALARDLGMNPAWMAQAYRAHTGEGLHQTLRRRRVEEAASMLRATKAPAAEIAVGAGFCDQSHMIRAFRNLLGRTPSQVRAEWQQLTTPGRG